MSNLQPDIVIVGKLGKLFVYWNEDRYFLAFVSVVVVC